jgi:hypothetical protein
VVAPNASAPQQNTSVARAVMQVARPRSRLCTFPTSNRCSSVVDVSIALHSMCHASNRPRIDIWSIRLPESGNDFPDAGTRRWPQRDDDPFPYVQGVALRLPVDANWVHQSKED